MSLCVCLSVVCVSVCLPSFFSVYVWYLLWASTKFGDFTTFILLLVPRFSSNERSCHINLAILLLLIFLVPVGLAAMKEIAAVISFNTELMSSQIN